MQLLSISSGSDGQQIGILFGIMVAGLLASGAMCMGCSVLCSCVGRALRKKHQGAATFSLEDELECGKYKVPTAKQRSLSLPELISNPMYDASSSDSSQGPMRSATSLPVSEPVQLLKLVGVKVTEAPATAAP